MGYSRNRLLLLFLLLSWMYLNIRAHAQCGHDLSGLVKGTGGEPITRATVNLLNSRQSLVASTSLTLEDNLT